MDNYTLLVKAIWYCSYEDKERTDYLIFNRTSFNEVMQECEEFYGDDLMDISITIKENGPTMITEEMYNELKEKKS